MTSEDAVANVPGMRCGRLRFLVCSVTVACIAAASTALAAAEAAPVVSVRPSAVKSGGVVSFAGRGFRTRGCGHVALRAYVPGVSPYPAVRVGTARVGTSGGFSRRWQVPKVSDRLVWLVEARQTCKSSGGQPKQVLTARAQVRVG